MFFELSGNIVVIGATGTGKSYLCQHLYLKNKRSIVYKVVQDDIYDGVYIYDLFSLQKYLENNYAKNNLKVVYDSELKDEKDLENFSYIVRYFKDCNIFFEEINNYTNPYYINYELRININAGRHYRINQFFITQRPSQINGAILSQARYIISFRQIQHRDLDRLSDFFNTDELPKLEKYEFKVWTRQEGLLANSFILKNNKIHQI